MQAAIFGLSPKLGSSSEDEEDLPQVCCQCCSKLVLFHVVNVQPAWLKSHGFFSQVVELPEGDPGAEDALPAVVELKPAASDQPKLSWRERAAQLKAQREGV